jgi:hypothetical protein
MSSLTFGLSFQPSGKYPLTTQLFLNEIILSLYGTKREDPMTQVTRTKLGLHLHNEVRRFGAPIDVTEIIHDEMPLGDEPVIEAEGIEELEVLLKR